jgi:DNA-binding response OmpR family regulator
MIRVMLVEDDPFVRRALISFLRATTEVVAFETLRDARARLDERWDGYVLDHGLPDGDGLSLAKEILARRGDASIVLFTAADPRDVLSEASAHGVLYAHKVDGISLLKRVVAGWVRAEAPAPTRVSDAPDA